MTLYGTIFTVPTINKTLLANEPITALILGKGHELRDLPKINDSINENQRLRHEREMSKNNLPTFIYINCKDNLLH